MLDSWGYSPSAQLARPIKENVIIRKRRLQKTQFVQTFFPMPVDSWPSSLHGFHVVADINFLMNRCWLALSPWRQSTLFATSECIWTQTCRWTHISKLVSFCFEILRQIRCLRRSLTRSSLSTVITAFILSKVDYCNVALSGLPKCDIDRLQSVINAAARLTSDLCRYDHVTPLLNDLHWLRDQNV